MQFTKSIMQYELTSKNCGDLSNSAARDLFMFFM